LPVLPRFPGLDRAAIIAVFEHTFRPKITILRNPLLLHKSSPMTCQIVGCKFALAPLSCPH
jgi:hypothetical protein